MLDSPADVVRAVESVAAGRPLPKQLAILQAALNSSPDDLSTVAARIHTTRRRLESVADSADPLREATRASLADRTEESVTKARGILGQLLLGALAERAFERIYQNQIGSDDLKLQDEREGHTGTDYRVVNGGGRQVFRLNIKFHGTLFERSIDLVGLESSDCFPLATYKIKQAVEREKAENLPYVFAIVSVPNLTTQLAGTAIPDDLVELGAFIKRAKIDGKGAIEDAIVESVIRTGATDQSSPVKAFASRIQETEWRLISATRAEQLLKERLFERVYAVSVKRFAQNYRNAEVDMHFSLSQDLTPLTEFLDIVKSTGLHGVTAQLTKGLI